MRAKLTIMLLTVACLAPGLSQAAGTKVAVCHVPPGNPANAHEIVVSENAIPAHISHGDSLGSCDGTSESPEDPKDCQTFIDAETESILLTFIPAVISVDDPTVESVAVTNLATAESRELLLAGGQVTVMVGNCSGGGLCFLDLDGAAAELPVLSLDMIEAAGEGCATATATVMVDD